MEEYIGKICPFCKAEIKENEEVKVCPECGVAHHASCWEDNKGCSTSGCSEHYCEEKHDDQNKVCIKCGAPIGDGQNFCPKCGYKVETGADEKVNAGSSQVDDGINKDKTNKKKLPIIIGIIVAVVIVIIVLLLGGGKKDFNKMYSDIANESWCTIGADGSYMKIDTDPKNKGEDMSWSEFENISFPATSAIERVNEELGFSSAVYEEMMVTRALDGRQSASSDKYEASWSYHPDQGLEVIYKFK